MTHSSINVAAALLCNGCRCLSFSALTQILTGATTGRCIDICSRNPLTTKLGSCLGRFVDHGRSIGIEMPSPVSPIAITYLPIYTSIAESRLPRVERDPQCHPWLFPWSWCCSVAPVQPLFPVILAASNWSLLGLSSLAFNGVGHNRSPSGPEDGGILFGFSP
ncbi:hypothetical protein BDB00DRAFT_935566 [Zychaea mexicana]|uniref:uncharacterized protein n=1 Tax=Zychaea mexicana TaxID=64656 RepID=UPI0022FE08BE|nr:uncharacterized protein BDB00DRAFT_935566 [Zychaea mexicana]KAI9498354.1 hypothetical protein BDB00DRAFT_935566 [Zychaea mexicana]